MTFSFVIFTISFISQKFGNVMKVHFSSFKDKNMYNSKVYLFYLYLISERNSG